MADFLSTGIIDAQTLQKLNLIPSPERIRMGPVAIIECPQEIPCDACVAACPSHAISKTNINSLPRIDFDKCAGCSLCLLACPGLAIFVVDLSPTNGKAYVTVPYEFLPVPKRGDKVALLDRAGSEIGVGEVVKVFMSRDRTYAITLEVDYDKAMSVRAFKISSRR